jgi:hypothetical protein
MNLSTEASGWPTPTAADAGRASGTYARGNPTLIGASNSWPTPMALGFDKSHQPGQSDIWPTPTATDAKSSGASYPKTETHTPGVTLTDAAVRRPAPTTPPDGQPTSATGRVLNPQSRVLNPEFVTALMGWPMFWTKQCDCEED